MWKSRFLPLRPSVESSKAFPITTDGETGVVSNGVPDWVYEGESMAGRCYPRSQFAHRRHSTGCPLSSWNWVGLTLILVFHQPSCSAASAKFPSAHAELGRQWNAQNTSQHDPVHEQMGHPVTPVTLQFQLCAMNSLQEEDFVGLADSQFCIVEERRGRT